MIYAINSFWDGYYILLNSISCVWTGQSTGVVINVFVTINNDNELYIAGTFKGTLFPDGGTGITIHTDITDIFVAKVDPNNCKILCATQGNSTNGNSIFLNSITNNNGVYATGIFSGLLEYLVVCFFQTHLIKFRELC